MEYFFLQVIFIALLLFFSISVTKSKLYLCIRNYQQYLVVQREIKSCLTSKLMYNVEVITIVKSLPW